MDFAGVVRRIFYESGNVSAFFVNRNASFNDTESRCSLIFCSIQTCDGNTESMKCKLIILR